MSEDFWPHKFTKLGDEYQIGERQVFDNTSAPVMAQRMVCVSCGVEFVKGKDVQPTGKCPARTTKKEMKRLKG
jgi:hypothetical protein